MTFTLQSENKPTIHIHSEQVELYERQREIWAIYKIKRDSSEGFLFVVIEVFNPASGERLASEEYRNYYKVVSEPVNEKGLIELIGISEHQDREVLNELGIDWEEKTSIAYGVYSEVNT